MNSVSIENQNLNPSLFGTYKIKRYEDGATAVYQHEINHGYFLYKLTHKNHGWGVSLSDDYLSLVIFNSLYRKFEK